MIGAFIEQHTNFNQHDAGVVVLWAVCILLVFSLWLGLEAWKGRSKDADR